MWAVGRIRRFDHAWIAYRHMQKEELVAQNEELQLLKEFLPTARKCIRILYFCS